MKILPGPRFAILSTDGMVVQCELLEWGEWMEKAERHVGEDWILGFKVSTVFLGLNHSYYPNRPPLWFETMIFGPRYEHKPPLPMLPYWAGDDLYMERYSTFQEAKDGHAEAVQWLKTRLDLSKKFQLQLYYPLNRKPKEETE